MKPESKDNRSIVSPPLVSVIIIFLNAEQFLQEAIESVFSQTYESWELLLVDDGSTDTSSLIAQGYAKLHPNRVFRLEHDKHQNRGMSASRNLGIQHAQGTFIAFLDADDVWVPNILEDQVSILQSHPEAAMVFGPIRYWYSWTGDPQDSERDFVESLGVQPDSLYQPPKLLVLFLQDKATVPSGILIRRVIIDKIGQFEDSFRTFYEDQVFCAKVCLAAPVYAAGECWYWYRQHPDATCSLGKITGEYHSARHAFLTWLADYLMTERISDPELWHALKRELIPFHQPIRHHMDRLFRSYKMLTGQLLRTTLRRILPVSVHRRLRDLWQSYHGLVPVGSAKFGNLRRVTPIDRNWGLQRGLPVDRYYIEQFLSANRTDIHGHVLEILDDTYTRQFGGQGVFISDVLHIKAGNPKATLIGDLTCGDHLPSDTFDCIIITQTIHLIYDIRAAVRTLHRIVKPGGVLLVTVPGISQISRYDMDRWGDYWRFTTRSISRLFEEFYPSNSVQFTCYGNVMAATAFLYGLAATELRQEELDHQDMDYQMLIAVRAVKPASQTTK